MMRLCSANFLFQLLLLASMLQSIVAGRAPKDAPALPQGVRVFYLSFGLAETVRFCDRRVSRWDPKALALLTKNHELQTAVTP